MNDDCRLCIQYNQGKEHMFDDDEISFFFFCWDPNPVSPGHLRIVPKRHISDFIELSRDELRELPIAALKAYKIIESADLKRVNEMLLVNFSSEKFQRFIKIASQKLERFQRKPDAYNHGLNDGKAAGRTIDHFHYHIIPRWEGDTDDPSGGIRHLIEGQGDYR